MIKFIQSEKFYMPIIYIAVAIIVYSIIANTITKIGNISPKNLNISKGVVKRRATVIGLINNIIKYVIMIIVVILILNIYGINTTSIIASLGVVSVIIGLAFQDIIKDLLAGMALVFDNAYAVGDWVEINGFKGEVIALGLKTTKIKAYTGEVKVISNSAFTEVVNYSLHHTRIIISIPLPYDIKIDKVEKILIKIKEQIENNKDVYSMELLGVDEFASSSINYAIVIECVPMTQIPLKREVLKLMKQTFDEEKIEIPYNQLDIHIKDKV